MPDRPAAARNTEPADGLEELLASGDVIGALLLPDSLTDRERDIARQAWEAGIAVGRAATDEQENTDAT